MSITSLIMMVYVSVIKPQNTKIMVVLTAAGEGLLLFLHLFSIVFLDDNISDEQQLKLGWLMIVIVGGYVLVNWVIILSITIKDMAGKFRQWKENKKLVKQKEKEEQKTYTFSLKIFY